MVVVGSDDEEERKHLLSQPASPCKVPTSDELDRLDWQEEMEESNKEHLQSSVHQQTFCGEQ